MCDFKPGDEVVCVYQGPWIDLDTGLVTDGPPFGEVCLVDGVEIDKGRAGLFLRGHGSESYVARLFRKVQRRDLSAWLETAAKNTDALDKPRPAPARRRERV